MAEEVEKPVKLCKRGHPRTPENLYKSGACRICGILNSLNYNRERGVKPVIKKLFCVNGHQRTTDNVCKNGSCKICRSLQSSTKNEAVKLRVKKWFLNNYTEQRSKQALRDKKYAKKQVIEISDAYIKHDVLKISGQVPKELLELARERIIRNRRLRSAKSKLKEQNNVDIVVND